MAEKIKDADDLTLEAMFRAEPIADDGFSTKVVRRIQRKIWVRRIALPLAAAVGASIAFKPLLGLLTALFGFASALPIDLFEVTGSLPPLHFIVSGAILLLGAVVGLRTASS